MNERSCEQIEIMCCLFINNILHTSIQKHLANCKNSLCNPGKLSQEHLNGIDLNQKIASFQDFIAVPTIPGLPMLRQHVPKLPGLHNVPLQIRTFKRFCGSFIGTAGPLLLSARMPLDV